MTTPACDSATVKEFIDKQNALKKFLKTEDDPEFKVDDVKLIGAVDISYSKTDTQRALAYLLVMEFPAMKVVWEGYHVEEQVRFKNLR